MDGNLELGLVVQAPRLQRSQPLMDRSTRQRVLKSYLSNQEKELSLLYVKASVCPSDLFKDITRWSFSSLSSLTGILAQNELVHCFSVSVGFGPDGVQE